MRILKTMALAATAYFAVTSCGNETTTTIQGDIKDNNFDQVVLYKITPKSLDALDTIAIADKKFNTTLNMDSADFVYLQFSQRFGIPMFIAPGENVQIELEDPEVMTYKITGSEESERIERINAILLEASNKVQELNEKGQAAMADTAQFEVIKPKLDSTFEYIVSSTKQQYMDMIDESPGSIANIFIFSQSIGNIPLITPQEDFEYFEKVGEGIKEKYPNSTHTKNYLLRIEEIRNNLSAQEERESVKSKLVPGALVPEIALENPQGQIMKLSDLRGKIVLVDFWAAWCRPCRMENPNLVRMYNEYKDRGFEVYSVSLDGLPNQQDPKGAWAKAIAQDKLMWDNHVSDLKGWSTSVINDFGFQGIPYTVLVDRDGKIIATELRGLDLETKLKEVL